LPTVCRLNQFRVPARWLLLFTFAGSLAAGIGLEAFYRAWPSRQRPFGLVAETVAFWGGAVGLVWLLDAHIVTPTDPRWSALWLSATLGALLVARIGPDLVWYGGPVWRRWTGGMLACTVLFAIAGELYLEGLDLQRNRPVPVEAYASLRPTLMQLLARRDDPGTYRIISIASSEYTPGDREDLRLSLPDLSPQALVEYISGAKYKEILAPNLPSVYQIPTIDGYDGGVLPLQRYVDLRTMLERVADVSADPRQRCRSSLPAGGRRIRSFGSAECALVVTDKLHDVWLTISTTT
jgi:hypothetical protein